MEPYKVMKEIESLSSSNCFFATIQILNDADQNKIKLAYSYDDTELVRDICNTLIEKKRSGRKFLISYNQAHRLRDFISNCIIAYEKNIDNVCETIFELAYKGESSLN